MTEPLIYGHRGAPRVARENTIEAFDAAQAVGVDGIEFDVRVAACGSLVLHHDPDFHSDGRQYMISTLTLKEIRDIEPEVDGHPYVIPTLDEVFARYGRELRYFIELKACNLPTPGVYEHAVARAIRRHDLVGQLLVSSFSADLVRRVAAVAPEIPTGLIFEHPAAIAELGNDGSSFPSVRALHPKWTIVDDDLASRAASAELPLHVWTINEPADLERVRAFGVASVTSDEPDRLLEAVGRSAVAGRAPRPRFWNEGVRRDRGLR